MHTSRGSQEARKRAVTLSGTLRGALSRFYAVVLYGQSLLKRIGVIGVLTATLFVLEPFFILLAVRHGSAFKGFATG